MMDERECVPRMKRKKPGHTSCNNCGKEYNNNAVPRLCISCNHYLGGKAVLATKPTVAAAFLVTAVLASVRQSDTGANVRIFVSIGEERKVREESQAKNVTKSGKSPLFPFFVTFLARDFPNYFS